MKNLQVSLFRIVLCTVLGALMPCTKALSDNAFRYYFRSLEMSGENPMHSISSILQDHQGFLWFGSMKNGLCRYDGLSFKYYNQEHGNLKNSFVTTLYEDENKEIWVGTDAGVYIYSPHTESIRRFLKKSDQGTSILNSVTTISGDGKGAIWISVDSQGLFRYDSKSGDLMNYFVAKSSQTLPHNITRFLAAPNSVFWIALYSDNLYFSTNQLKTLTPFVSNTGEQPFKGETIYKILPAPNNCLYIATSKGGVKEINLADKSVRTLLSVDEKGKNIYMREIMFYSENELWFGTESGLFIYTLSNGQFTHLQAHNGDSYSLSDNAIYALCKDREGGIWIGSYFGGINYYPKQYTHFEKIYPQAGMRDIGLRIREFSDSNDGTIWIGTEDAGLYNYNPADGTIQHFQHPLLYSNIHGLYRDGDYLWVGTFSKGLNRINLRTKELKNYMEGSMPNSLNASDVFTIGRRSKGGIWIGTTYGLLWYNYATDEFTRIPELNGVFVYDLTEDCHGNLWLATYVNGLYRHDAKSGKWEHFQHEEKNPYSLPSNKILSIFEDSKGQMWFTTNSGGFCRFDPSSRRFVSYDFQKGLPSNTIYQIVEDHNGLFWVTTNNGLVCFNPSTEEIKLYTQADGLLSDQFNYQSSYRDRSGKIYLGGIHGFIVFNPSNFVQNTFIPPVVLTDFRLFDKEAPIGTKKSPLKESITWTEELVLASNQNTFSFRIAALSFQAPQKNKLIYKLEGFDTDWHSVGQLPIISYSNLPYGAYEFKVKGSNSDGVWNENVRILKIHILPPFYLSWWAYCIYVIVGGIAVWLTFRAFKTRTAERNRREMDKFEQEKERELYTAKIDFFTNVTHEIRTPLTLIKAPLENLLNKKKLDPEVEEDLKIMDRNTNRLLNLINQLLDFRKTERQGFKLSFVSCDVVQILQSIVIRFIPFARQKEIEFLQEIPVDPMWVDMDQEAFTKMMSNLLTNAIKHAQSRLCLSCVRDMETNMLRVLVRNDGLVIPVEMREEIFKPFIQYKEVSRKTAIGTGIGLALSRSLAELHQGTLSMTDSTEYNEFLLCLPLTQAETVGVAVDTEKENKAVLVPESETVPGPVEEQTHADLPVLLLVEDNVEMAAYISRQLRKEYTVFTASDGVEALETLKEQFVNLVISDVMMPRMDGIELCTTLKSDLNYSHIPVILLTAKTALQSKIEGLNSGADMYVEKPFSVEYLQASIASLLRNRKKVKEACLRSPFVNTGSVAITKADEKFLRQLHEIVEEHMQNPDFCLDDIVDLMYMSRSSLNRKLKGLLDITPNDYIRLERLKRAAVLLKEEGGRINEVCYQVGFNTPSYFAKCFQKQFGVLPKDFVTGQG